MFNFISTAYAQVATSTITMPAGFTDSVLAQANAFFSSWAGYITMIVGVILALLAVGIIIDHLKK